MPKTIKCPACAAVNIEPALDDNEKEIEFSCVACRHPITVKRGGK